jgi:hypothetical protein
VTQRPISPSKMSVTVMLFLFLSLAGDRCVQVFSSRNGPAVYAGRPTERTVASDARAGIAIIERCACLMVSQVDLRAAQLPKLGPA